MCPWECCSGSVLMSDAPLHSAVLCSCSREFSEIAMRGRPCYRDSQTHLSPLHRAEWSCCTLLLVSGAAKQSQLHSLNGVCLMWLCLASVQQTQGWQEKLMQKKELLGSYCAVVGVGCY